MATALLVSCLSVIWAGGPLRKLRRGLRHYSSTYDSIRTADVKEDVQFLRNARTAMLQDHSIHSNSDADQQGAYLHLDTVAEIAGACQ